MASPERSSTENNTGQNPAETEKTTNAESSGSGSSLNTLSNSDPAHHPPQVKLSEIHRAHDPHFGYGDTVVNVYPQPATASNETAKKTTGRRELRSCSVMLFTVLIVGFLLTPFFVYVALPCNSWKSRNICEHINTSAAEVDLMMDLLLSDFTPPSCVDRSRVGVTMPNAAAEKDSKSGCGCSSGGGSKEKGCSCSGELKSTCECAGSTKDSGCACGAKAAENQRGLRKRYSNREQVPMGDGRALY